MNPTSPISQIIRSRRSTKPVDMDAERAVERSVLEKLLEDATWAPTHGLTEPWKFIVIQGNARAELARVLQQTYKETMPPAEFREDKFTKMGENPLRAPVIIAACFIRKGGSKIPAWEEEAAAASAVQNLLLSATGEGLASFWSSSPVLRTAAFAQWLGLGAEDHCIGLIYLGHAKANASASKASRGPLSTCVEWRS
jgi:nitroreductase